MDCEEITVSIQKAENGYMVSILCSSDDDSRDWHNFIAERPENVSTLILNMMENS